MVSLTNMTVNKVVLSAGESVHQDAKGQPMPPKRWPTEFSDGDGRDRRHRRGMAGGGGGDVPMGSEGEDGDPPPPYWSSEPTLCETETAR